MNFVQLCNGCGKFRELQEGSWTPWQDARLMTEHQRFRSQKVRCPSCDRQLAAHRQKRTATTMTAETLRGYAEPL